MSGCDLRGDDQEGTGFTDAAALKKAALELSSKLKVMTGPYEIDETGKQLQMPFIVTQVQPTKEYRLTLLYPEDVVTGKVLFPIPPWDRR